MGFWKFMFDNDWKQRSDIHGLEEKSRRLAMRMSRSQDFMLSEFEDVEDKLASLALYCRTLLHLLKSKGIVTPEEFRAAMDTLDAEDGEIDGR